VGDAAALLSALHAHASTTRSCGACRVLLAGGLLLLAALLGGARAAAAAASSGPGPGAVQGRCGCRALGGRGVVVLEYCFTRLVRSCSAAGLSL
jgi:hypothetical protein